jgi:MATE family multidrug resistance protein
VLASQIPAQPLSHRRVLKIALPVVLSNATVPILGAVDTGVVGQLGEAAPIGAVGIGAIILSTIYWIFGFLRMGTVGLTGQAIGARDAAEVSALLSRVLMIAGAAGLMLIALQGPIIRAAFLIAPASAEVEALARDYMAIRIFSAPAAIAIYGLTGWMIAHERTTGMLVLQLGMNLLNILLSIFFVLGLGWGVQGVALGTFVSEWAGFALGLWLCRGAFRRPAWRDWPRVFDRARLIHMAMVNTDILIRSVILMAGFTSFLFIGADFGDVPLAANQILMQFMYITAYAMDGFAFAAEALVGQAMGARASGRLRRSALLTGFWGLMICIAMAIGFALLGGWMIDVMTTAPEVRTEARTYLPWMVAAPLVGCAAWMLDGIFIGATRSRDMRNMMILSGLVYLAALWALVPAFGNHGLWAALLVFFAARGVSLAVRYPALERAAG